MEIPDSFAPEVINILIARNEVLERQVKGQAETIERFSQEIISLKDKLKATKEKKPKNKEAQKKIETTEEEKKE